MDPAELERRRSHSAFCAMLLLGVEPWNEPLRVHSLAGVADLLEASFGYRFRRSSIMHHDQRHHPGSGDDQREPRPRAQRCACYGEDEAGIEG